MKHTLRSLAMILALQPALAGAQQFPVISDHSVIGRIGIVGQSGPSQAIPFTTLLNQMTSANNKWPGDVYFASGRPWVDVRAYGATGNGSTNDTVAVNSAITTLQALPGAGSGILYFPPGTYCLNGGVTITSLGVRVVGAGDSSTLSACGSNVTPITLNGPYAEIKDVTVLGYNAPSATLPAITLGPNCVSCVIQHAFVQYGTGILNTSADTVLEHATAMNSYGSAVVRATSGAFYVRRSKIDQNYPVSVPAVGTNFNAWASGTAYTAGAIVSTGGFYIQVKTGGTSAGTAPTVQPYAVNMPDNTVTWQLVGPVTYYGVQMDTGANAVFISESDFTGPFLAGVAMTNTLAGSPPQLMTIEGSVFGQSYQAGIWAHDGAALNVKGSQFSNCIGSTCNGILLSNNWTGDTTITGNLIISNPFGIAVSAGTNTTIADNNIFGSTNSAINVNPNITKFNIIGNHAGSSATWGANFRCITINTGASDVYNITGNDCSGFTGTGILDNGTGTNKFVDANGGKISVPSGGTGAASLTAHGVLLGEGTGAITPTAAMTNGQLLVGQAGADPAPQTVSGDCTFSAAGVLTCTKINSVAVSFGGAFTTAGAVSLPVIAQGDLWYGSAAGIKSALAKSTGTSNFLKNSGTSNNPAWAQPSCADLSGVAASCATDATNGANLQAHTVPASALANTWTSYAPTISCGSGTITTLGTVTGSFYDIGALRYVEIVIPITTNGTCAGAIVASLPSTPASANTVITGVEQLSSGSILSSKLTGSNIVIVNYNNTYPGGTGFKIVMDGWYRTN